MTDRSGERHLDCLKAHGCIITTIKRKNGFGVSLDRQTHSINSTVYGPLQRTHLVTSAKNYSKIVMTTE